MEDRVQVPVYHSDRDFIMVVKSLYNTRKLEKNWQSWQKEYYTNRMKPTVQKCYFYIMYFAF